MSNNSHNYNFTFSSFCATPPHTCKTGGKEREKGSGKRNKLFHSTYCVILLRTCSASIWSRGNAYILFPLLWPIIPPQYLYRHRSEICWPLFWSGVTIYPLGVIFWAFLSSLWNIPGFKTEQQAMCVILFCFHLLLISDLKKCLNNRNLRNWQLGYH